MKKLSAILLIALLLPLSCVAQKNMFAEKRIVPSFSEVDVCCGIHVFLSQEKSNEITIETDNEKALEYVSTKVNDDELKISISNIDKLKLIGKNIMINVYVPVEYLESIDASSASTVKNTTDFNVNNLEISASSAAYIDFNINKANKIECEISSSASISSTINQVYSVDCEASSAAKADIKLKQCNNIYLESSSASSITISGSGDNAKASASSGAKIDIKNFDATIAEVEASSGSKILVKARKFLKAAASSGGDILYYGDPDKVVPLISSGGSIKPQ